MVSGGAHNRKPNGILGALCREHFPGLVEHGGVRESAYTWDHYMAVADVDDWEGRNFGTKARRVVGELWVSNRGITLVKYWMHFKFLEYLLQVSVLYAGFLQVRSRL